MSDTKGDEAVPRRSLATTIIALSLLTAGIGTATAALSQQREGGFVGPEEGETLAEWTARWLDGPVQYIASEDEVDFYRSLETTQERLQFIRLFWERRDPQIRGPENEFLDEFQERIDYANENFGNGTPGWKTVFGRVVLVLGPPSRSRREMGLPPGLSDRPAILWTYDRRIPEWPPNEDLLFVFQRGRWRLMPPNPIGDSGTDQARRELERQSLISELPVDFERASTELIVEMQLHPVDYDQVVRQVEAAVAFPDAEIPFGWQAVFGPGDGDLRRVELRLTWRMESLIFHVVDNEFQTDMIVRATLFAADGEPVADTSERIGVSIPVEELEQRAGELVERAIVLQASAGTYSLELVLEDQLLGYRTAYRDTLEVPADEG